MEFLKPIFKPILFYIYLKWIQSNYEIEIMNSLFLKQISYFLETIHLMISIYLTNES